MTRLGGLGVISFLAALLAALDCLAAGNPLDVIAAGSYDGQSGGIRIEAGKAGDREIVSVHSGDYLVYNNFDFDSGVAAFQARLASPNKGVVEVRLDSLTGHLLGTCSFDNTGGWQNWRDITCKVDNSQAGVRDIYLVFRGDTSGRLLNLRSFVFLKSIIADPTQVRLGFPDRTDPVDDEPQAVNSWGMPETGFSDDFESGRLNNWKANGITLTRNANDHKYWAASLGTNLNYAFTPEVYINKTDTGGEWRTLAEATLAADIIIDSPSARPGIGFTSKDGNQWIYVDLNAASNTIEVWRKLADGSLTEIRQHPKATDVSDVKWIIRSGLKYRLQIDWSPYSDGLIAFLYDENGAVVTTFRTVIDLPAARRPLLVCSGGRARFGNVRFDPNLDGWNARWQWKKSPVLTPDVCNPAVWKGKDGLYYMMWRKFGKDTYHGIASSPDGINWTRITDHVLKCTGDMNVLVDPFGDGLIYITPGSANMAWWTSDGSNHFTEWKDSGMNLGNIFGNSRIQEFIDTAKYPQMKPVQFNGVDYRFIGFTENWTDLPKPHTVVLLSNTLTNWVLANPDPVIPPGANFWGEKGNAIGAAFVLPDGNILLASCSCTFEGYTGAPEPSNVSAIVDGRQPWKVLKLGVLPDAPVSRENVWYEGPNFGTAFYYEPKNDTLYFYGGFHDYSIGMMRVQNVSRSRIFTSSYTPPVKGNEQLMQSFNFIGQH